MRKINQKKELKLLSERGVSFDEIVSEGELLDVRENPGYSGQLLLVYKYKKYVWVVVIGTNPDRYITAYPSRKMKKEFGV